MRPPIFIAEGLDLGAYATEDDAICAVEWQDVDDGIYVAYDSEGRLLTLSVDPPSRQPKRFLGLTWDPGGEVRLDVAEDEPTHQEDLRSLILRFRSALGEATEGMEGEPLPVLVNWVTARLRVKNL